MDRSISADAQPSGFFEGRGGRGRAGGGGGGCGCHTRQMRGGGGGNGGGGWQPPGGPPCRQQRAARRGGGLGSLGRRGTPPVRRLRKGTAAARAHSRRQSGRTCHPRRPAGGRHEAGPAHHVFGWPAVALGGRRPHDGRPFPPPTPLPSWLCFCLSSGVGGGPPSRLFLADPPPVVSLRGARGARVVAQSSHARGHMPS